MDREAELTALHDIATTIQSAETAEEAAEQTVTAAAEILDFHICSIELLEDGWLVPYAVSEESPEGGARRMRPDQGLAGKTFQSGESHIVDDVASDDASDPADAAYRSGLSVPIGDHGVFQAVGTEPNSFDESDRERAELLVSHTAGALDRIEREATLEEKNDRLEAFASIVSHDLRSPLGVATSRIELAQSECNSDHLGKALEALDQMERLIDDLLTLSRQGDVIDDSNPVSLGTVAHEAWEIVRTRDAALDIQTDDTVRADRDRLRQLLVNLLRNSIEHGGTDVTVSVGALDDQTGFFVADDGAGISADDTETLFESGYSTADGTGLGLQIVDQITEAHGWSVTVSEGPDGGARFEFVTDGE